MKRRKIFSAIYLLLLATLPLNAQMWTHVGPISDGTPGNVFETGRLDCFAPDFGFNGTTNQIIYAGSSSGSLWKTTDLANTWNPVVIPDVVPFHGILGMGVSPAGNYLLVSTINCGAVMNSYGNIFQYFPAVNGWIGTNFLAAAGPASTAVHHITFCPTNANLVFAAGDNGLYRSTDGGMNWTQVLTGIFENVEFVPANYITGGFQVYACGNNTVVYSTDMGLTFSTQTLITSILGATYYADLAVTYDASNPIGRYVYIDALVGGMHHIVRLFTDQTSPSFDYASDFGFMNESAPSSDRMCCTAYDQVVYFGHGGLGKYNAFTSQSYYIPSIGIDLASTWVNYNSPGHSDSHDILILPAYNLILYCSDGGFYVDNYTPQANSEYINNWLPSNNGLNISQIWGLSCTDDDTAAYITGEQDTKAFLTSAATTTFFSGGTEPSQVFIDKFNSNNYFYSGVAADDHLYGSYNSISLFNQFVEMPAIGGNICNSVSCPPSWFPGTEFGTNTLFQDPNRPDKVFFGTGNTSLFELCPTTGRFTQLKGFPSAGWSLQYVSGMAFSRANKNKVYATLSNRNDNISPDLRAPKVFVYNDVDFDNSWAGYQDSWFDITPNYAAPPFTVPVILATDLAQIQTVGVAASDWNPDRIWTAIRYVPGNPGLKVLKYEAGVWTDYSTGIPANEIPVSMVYEQGTNDKLYLGTNVNIYYRDATMSSWVLFSGGLPNICMNQLRINYVDNTLRVGTFGHGMWKKSLSCPPTASMGFNGGIFTTDNFYEASINIYMQNVNITNGHNILHAGEYIDLLPDFFVAANTTTSFYAFIHGCSTPGTTFREAADDIFQEEDPVEELQNKLSVYPNPTNGIFTVGYAAWKEKDQQGSVSVFDFSGKLILQQTVTTGQRVDLDLSNESAGVYFVRFTSPAGVQSAKVIRQ